MKTIVKPYTTVYTIRGHKYTVTSPARFNENGEVIADRKLDDMASKKALDMFRKDQNYVYPSDIKAFRKKLNFNQKDMANLLGMSPNTIAMYELGALPNEANNTLLKLVMTSKQNLKIIVQNENVSAKVKKLVNEYLKKQDNKTNVSISLDEFGWFGIRHQLFFK